jgi:hypothetical protein
MQLRSPLFESFGLGQVIEPISVYGKKSMFVSRDLDGDGIIDFGVKTLNERSSSLFLYSYNKVENNFIAKRIFNQNGNQSESVSMIIGTIDFPIVIKDHKIIVYFSKDQFYTYKLKKNAYYKVD